MSVAICGIENALEDALNVLLEGEETMLTEVLDFLFEARRCQMTHGIQSLEVKKYTFHDFVVYLQDYWF